MTLNSVLKHMVKHERKMTCTCPFILKGSKIKMDMMKMDCFYRYPGIPEKYVLTGELYGRKIFERIK